MGFEIYAKNGIKIFINIIFLFFVIFSKSYEQKLIMPIESCFLDGKKPNTAKLVDMNFWADSVKYSQVIPLAKIQAKTAVFCKSYQNVPTRVFLHVEFISALKAEPKSMGFEKYAKNGIKIFIIIIFFFF